MMDSLATATSSPTTNSTQTSSTVYVVWMERVGVATSSTRGNRYCLVTVSITSLSSPFDAAATCVGSIPKTKSSHIGAARINFLLLITFACKPNIMSRVIKVAVLLVVLAAVLYVYTAKPAVPSNPCPISDSAPPALAPDMSKCFAKLWAEAGCVPAGSLYVQTTDPTSPSYRYWANLPNMTAVKTDMNLWRSLAASGDPVRVQGCLKQ